MIKKGINYLLLTLILLQLVRVQSQDQIKEITITLTKNERYYLDLNSFYQQTIQSITFSEDPSIQPIPPSKILNHYNQQLQMNYELPTSFPLSGSQKNIIKIISVANNDQFDFVLVFGRIYYEEGAIYSKEFDRYTLFTNPKDLTQTSTSMYSSTAGFAQVVIGENNYKTYQFTVSDQLKLNIINIQSSYLFLQPKSIQLQNKIYTYSTQQDNKVYLYSFDSVMQSFSYANFVKCFCPIVKQIKEVSNINYYYIVQDCNDYVNFFYNNSNDLKSVFINIPSTSSYTLSFSQMVNSDIYITFIKDQSLLVCRFTNTNFVVSLQQCQQQATNQQFSNAAFVSDKLLLLQGETTLALYDFSQSRFIFSQNSESDTYYSFLNFLNSQVLINIYKGSSRQYSETQSIQFSSPAISIQSIVNIQKYNVQITVGPIPLIYQGVISVNIVNQPQITFSTPSVTIGSTYSGQSYNSQTVFTFPIEQYVTGQNLQIQSQAFNSLSNSVQSLFINKFIKDTTFFNNFVVDQSFTSYILNQFPYNSILVSKQEVNKYSISYTTVSMESRQIFQTVPQNPIINSPIDILDGTGSFTLQSDQTSSSKKIYVPVVPYYINSFSFNCDTSKTFTFASDIKTNTLLVMCGSVITQINYLSISESFSQPTIINQTTLQRDFTTYSNILCRYNSMAYIYGSKFITKYDYINQIFQGAPIEIPQIDDSQQIILFQDFFFVLYTDSNKNPQIIQYSYNNFSSGFPLLIRNVSILTQSLPQLNRVITLRDNNPNNFEYLLIGVQGQSNQQLVYRVNNCSSQNQLFGVITIEDGLTVFSNQAICKLGVNSYCQKILKSAELSFQAQLENYIYISSVQYLFEFTPRYITNKYQQNSNESTQKYQFVLRRDTSAAYGVVDQSAKSIQNLKTYIQDNQYINSNTVFSLNDGGDPFMFTNNLLGWQLSNSQGKLVNRLIEDDSQPLDSMTYTIMYNQRLIVSEDNFKINDITIKEQTNLIKCVGLEDSSLTKKYLEETQLILYFICSDYVQYFQIQLTNDRDNGFLSSQILKDIQYNMEQQVASPGIYVRIFSSLDIGIRLYTLDNKIQSQLILDDKTTKATIAPIQINQSTFISSNIIQAFNNMILSFQADGTIYTTEYNNKNPSHSLYNIKNLLRSYNFIVKPDDTIIFIKQVQDNSFVFQLTNYIYQIIFYYSSNQLAVQRAQSYDFKDGFKQMISYYDGNKSTIIVGQNTSNQIIVNLYSGGRTNDDCKVITAWYLKQYEDTGLVVNSYGSIDDNVFKIYLSNFKMLQLALYDNTVITLQQSQIGKQQFSITPLQQNNSNNIVSFFLANGKVVTNSKTLSFGFLFLLSLMLVLL